MNAPASEVTPNLGGTGNCNLVEVEPGKNMIVPADGDGAYDIDLATAVPVPSYDEDDPEQPPTGYWACTSPMVGSGVITPAAVPGEGEYNLYDFPVVLSRLAKIALLGTLEFAITLPMCPPRILPQWKSVVALHNSGHEGLEFALNLAVARCITVP